MFTEFMVKSFYSRAARGNRRIAGYVIATIGKYGLSENRSVAARSIAFFFEQ
jgi:hypothetical protein